MLTTANKDYTSFAVLFCALERYVEVVTKVQDHARFRMMSNCRFWKTKDELDMKKRARNYTARLGNIMRNTHYPCHLYSGVPGIGD